MWKQAGIGRAQRRPSGDADLGQRRGPRIPPHHRGRRQIPVHRQGRGGEQERKPVSLYPYALISRHGTPQTLGYYILHEGLIGKFGDEGLKEVTYKKIEEKKINTFDATNGWLGITDKYWAAVLLPKTDAHVMANFKTDEVGTIKTYQTDYLLDAQTIAPGATGTADARLFAGAKEVQRRQRLREPARTSTTSIC